MSQFMVGRQPIFDAKLDVRGYELLFRDPSFPVLNGDAMTADVLVHAGLDVGLRSLVGDKLAFVNATRAFLVGEQEFPFPPGQTVIEVLEDVRREPEVVAGCRRLVDSGYRLALDDYVWEQDDPLLALVSIVKLDVLALTPAQLEHAVSQRCGLDLQLVAEKVETRQQLDDCQEMGFDLYQGYLLSRPEVVEGQTLSPSRVTCLKVIEKLCDPDTSAREVERTVQTDAALSYRFLRVAGTGASQGLFRRLKSVRDAIVLLGQRRLRAWLTLMLLDGAEPGSDEMLHIAMTRAHDRAHGPGAGARPDRRRLHRRPGLGSRPAPPCLDHPDRGEPVAQSRAGERCARALRCARRDHGGRAGLGGRGENFQLRSGPQPEEVERCYLHALAWANEVCGVLALTG